MLSIKYEYRKNRWYIVPVKIERVRSKNMSGTIVDQIGHMPSPISHQSILYELQSNPFNDVNVFL